MSIITPLEAALRLSGQSLTTARKTVFEALQDTEPLTMSELVARCPSVNRASVYRTVAMYEQLGIVQRLQTGWKYKLELTGAFHEHHHHVTCLLCGNSFVVPEDEIIERHLKRLASDMGFRLERHQLELQGHCVICQELLKD
jgi:Fe2+ or Zn2+ uptake regulation protein